MGSITFESNELHYPYITFSSLPLPLDTFWKSNHYHYTLLLSRYGQSSLWTKHSTKCLTAIKRGVLLYWYLIVSVGHVFPHICPPPFLKTMFEDITIAHFLEKVIITITHYFCPDMDKVHFGQNIVRSA